MLFNIKEWNKLQPNNQTNLIATFNLFIATWNDSVDNKTQDSNMVSKCQKNQLIYYLNQFSQQHRKYYTLPVKRPVYADGRLVWLWLVCWCSIQ